MRPRSLEVLAKFNARRLWGLLRLFLARLKGGSINGLKEPQDRQKLSVVKASLGTHDGTFHADEVTAAALLLLFGCIDRDKIVRTRQLSELQQCEYVCDVGGIYDPSQKRFDHHQLDYRGSLSSAGMVLNHLLEDRVIDQPTYELLNGSLIRGVDAHDNGLVVLEPGTCTFSQVITNFVPPIYDASPELMRQGFDEAVDFATSHLQRLWHRFQQMQQYRGVVELEMSKQEKVLVFDRALPWMDLFFEMGGEQHPALFVVMPAGVHWKVRAIPPNSRDRMGVRYPLPMMWAGLMDDSLKLASNIAGALFCHKSRFISIWETKEDALKAVRRAMQHENHL